MLVIGDAVTNLDGLQILPEKYCADLPLLLNSLRALRALQFDIACFAHGLPIIGKAREKLARHRLKLAGFLLNRGEWIS